MKFSSAWGLVRSRMPLIAMLALAATSGLAGCEGDNGSSGPSDPPDGGGSGPPGPTGPGDAPIMLGGDVRDVGTGAALTARQVKDIGTLVATLDSAAITGNKVVVEFTLKTPYGGKVLGLAPTTLRLGIAKLVPAAGGGLPSRWQSYINRSASPSISTPALPSAIQANAESGIAAGWTELGAGRYRYTSAVDLTQVTTPIAVAYEPSLTHRVSLAIDLAGSQGQRALAPDNPYKDFLPSGGTPTSKLVSTTANCAGCHVRFAEHGGPRRTVEYCVVCHNPATVDPDSGESVDLAYMAHSIHRGEARDAAYVVYGFNGMRFDYSEVTYPQPASFCETCHTTTAASPQGDDWQSNPNVAACGGCHVAGVNKTGPSATTGRYTYTFTHPVGTLDPEFLTFNDGNCSGCHRVNGAAGGVLEVHQRDPDRKAIENGELFTYKILKVEDAEVGKSPKVTFQILGTDGTPLDVKAITTGRLRLDFAWSSQDVHNVADIAGDTYAADRGEAIVINLIDNMASVTANGDGTYSYTLDRALPAGFADAALGTGLLVVLEGRRQMPDGSEAYPDSAYAYAGGTARARLVDQAKCETCHKKVAIHGGSRAGDPIICTACHNSSVGGQWLENDGVTVADYGPIALGAFIHNLHASNVPALDAITYPQSLARCTGCHVDEKVYGARTNALPITVDAGTTAGDGPETLAWKDDLADSATAGTCKGCHTTDPATAQAAIDHMASQGGYFGLPKTLTPTSSVEGCPLCHGAGSTFDVAKAHCDALPYGECTD